MIHKVVRFVLRNQRVHGALRAAYTACFPERYAKNELGVEIPEVSPIIVRRSELPGRRINLLIPALSTQHVFGGIATALVFFHKLTGSFDNARIIVTDEVVFNSLSNSDYAAWKVLSLDEEDRAGNLIVCAGDRWNRSLAVGEGDVFVATAWWTAVVLKNILQQKRRLWNQEFDEKYVYLIQDYEPGFYAWSSRYALAEASYHDQGQCVAVFNTSFLKIFFDSRGYFFENNFVFEPVLHKKLRPFLEGCLPKARERSVLIYGRPGVSRNAFELIVMGLKLLVDRIGGEGWFFYSAGEAHQDVGLGKGAILRSLGKLSLEEYAELLQKCYAGVSLMVSPHPSYPPLEMAAFGINVVTNRYEEKCLSVLSENIKSVEFLSAEKISDGLFEILTKYDQEPVCAPPETAFFKEYVRNVDPFDRVVPPLLVNLGV